MRKLRFLTRRRLKWVAVIAAGLFAALFISTLWFSPTCATLSGYNRRFLTINRGCVTMITQVIGPTPASESYTITSIEKNSPTGFDLWFHTESGMPVYIGGPPAPGKPTRMYRRLTVPLWFPFLVLALGAVYLWRTDRAEPWQCAGCRYDLRGIDSDICPECGKQFESAS